MKTDKRYSVRLACAALALLLAFTCAVPAVAADVSAPREEISAESTSQASVLRFIPEHRDKNGRYVFAHYEDEDGNTVELEDEPAVRAMDDDLPASYNAKDAGFVTSVKNQKSTGTCWAFATIASAESSYIKQGYGTSTNTDFSEAHLVWFAMRYSEDSGDTLYHDGVYKENPFTDGLNWRFACAALMRGSGFRLESKSPWTDPLLASNYPKKNKQDESTRYDADARLVKAVMARGDSVDAAKRLLLENGNLTVTYQHNTDGYSSANNCLYYSKVETDCATHRVEIVGWNDNYSRTKFLSSSRPSSNGAWLIKNSWGKSHGDDGYDWISYEHASLSEYVSCVVAPKSTFDNIYQYDGTYLSLVYTMRDGAHFGNLFTSKQNELLTHASFYLPVGGMSAEVKVYAANSGYVLDKTDPTSGMSYIPEAAVTMDDLDAGYHTVALPVSVPLAAGDRFFISVTLHSPTSDSVKIATENTTSYTTDDGRTISAVKYPDVSFMSQTSYVNGWTTSSGNVPVKAMTKKLSSATGTPQLTLLMPPAATDRVGSAPDMTGMMLTYRDVRGQSTAVTGGYACSPAVFKSEGVQTVTLTYRGLQVTYNTDVQGVYPALGIETMPTRTYCQCGEEPDLTGLALRYHSAKGQSQLIYANKVTADSCIRHTACDVQVPVHYEGCTVYVPITMEFHREGVTISGNPTKGKYALGESPDLTGFSIRNWDRFGYSTSAEGMYTVTPEVFDTLGTVRVTVKCSSMTCTYSVKVVKQYETIAIRTLPKTTYRIGEKPNMTGLTLTYTNEDGVESVVTSGFTVPDKNSILTRSGTKTLTVKYFGIETPLVLTVERTPGDADGDLTVSLKDAVAITRTLTSSSAASVYDENADVDGNGVVNLRDVVRIKRYLAEGWDVELV